MKRVSPVMDKADGGGASGRMPPLTFLSVEVPPTGIEEICEECCNGGDFRVRLEGSVYGPEWGTYYDEIRPGTLEDREAGRIVVSTGGYRRFLFRVRMSEKRVLIQVRIKLVDESVPKNDGADVDGFIAYQQTRVPQVWSRRWGLLVERDNCNPRYLHVDFEVTISRTEENADYDMTFHAAPEDDPKGLGFSYVGGYNVGILYPHHFYWDSRGKDPQTGEVAADAKFDNSGFAHEFGHMIGLPDEYLLENHVEKTIIYFNQMRQEEHVPLQPGEETDGIMGLSNSGMKYSKTMPENHTDIGICPARYYYFTAIETQKLLREQLNDDTLTCRVVPLQATS